MTKRFGIESGSWRLNITLLTVLLILLPKDIDGIRCSVCESGSWGYGCVTNPPPAQPCKHTHNHCIVITTHTSAGDLDTFTRTCSPFSMPDTCRAGVERATGRPLEICYATCPRDGCNRSASIHRILNLLRRRRRRSRARRSVSMPRPRNQGNGTRSRMPSSEAGVNWIKRK